jgi:tRNA-specific 2-thiouridylase
MSRVLLAMSGGVDSSVAAALLREEGHEVIGLFMRHGQREEDAECGVRNAECGMGSAALPIVELAHKQGCCTAADAQDARRVADKLEIPFYAMNFEEEFGQIIDYFVDEYTAGRTPNPCVVCNNWLKFGRLFDYADGIGAEFVATGHYARLLPAAACPASCLPPPASSPSLCRGLDPAKDQSYVLFGIRRELLPRLMFPVGGFCKAEIRDRARRLGLRVADKKDSQEICFVTSGDHAAFVRRRRESDLSGEIVTTAGEVVGQHAGIEGFTVGQRKGLGVALGEPYFVVRLEPQSRRVIIGRRDELARTEFTAKSANWLIDEPCEPLRCQVKIRYQSDPVAATVEPLCNGRLRFTLDQPKHGIAPGQAAVCYDGDRVLGGGWIE